MYNEKLKTVIMLNGHRAVWFHRERKDLPHDEWVIDTDKSPNCSDTLKLPESSKSLVMNHVSPNGKYILACANGLQIYEFTKD